MSEDEPTIKPHGAEGGLRGARWKRVTERLGRIEVVPGLIVPLLVDESSAVQVSQQLIGG